MALRTHLSNIDSIIQLHDNRLYALDRSFQQELKTTQDDFLKEKDIISTKFSKEKVDLRAVINAIEQEESARETDVSYSFALETYYYNNFLIFCLAFSHVRQNMLTSSCGRR